MVVKVGVLWADRAEAEGEVAETGFKLQAHDGVRVLVVHV